jgi:undecaprenyl diphosphate synthase
LSKENLGRSPDHLQAALDAEGYALRELLPRLCERWEASVNIAGDVTLLPEPFRNQAIALAQQTHRYSKRKIYFLLAYNPWDEIRHALAHCDDLDHLEQALWVKEPVDLVIRTAGGCRLSNFLPLQSGYAELEFFDCFFNDLRLVASSLNHRWSIDQCRHGIVLKSPLF